MYASVAIMLIALAGILFMINALAGWSATQFGILFVVAGCITVIGFYVASWLVTLASPPKEEKED